MRIIWGCLIAALGLFMLICGLTKSELFIYSVLASRSKILWGENVHSFYSIVGTIVTVFGALVALGYIRRQ